MKFPILYHKGKKGELHTWRIWTDGPSIYTEHGQQDGKKQITPGKIATPKNVGKKNATTAEEQANIEAKAMWVYKVERKYSEDPRQAEEELFLPMTAKNFKDLMGKGVKYPADVQPKLDGVRAMASMEDGEVILGTRGGKVWTVPTHINAALKKIMTPEMVIDGELYIHGVLFEDLASWTKKRYPETDTLEFHIFDMPINELGENLPWVERKKNLSMWAAGNVKAFGFGPLRLVDTKPVYSMDDVLKAEEQALEDGYEGVMVRNLDGPYLFGHKSSHIYKVKSSNDAEYKVVGFHAGKGKFSKSVIWECVTKDGDTFDVIPKTTQPKREKLFKEGKQHIGEWLKVRYQNLTEYGKPRFPRGIGFRDEKDMD